MAHLGLYENVVVALDYTEVEKAYALVDQMGDRIQHFKIGPQLFLQNGPQIVNFLIQRKKKIFIDLKLHDTPHVVGETVSQIADMGADFTTVHCMGGRRMLERANQSCRGSHLKIIGLTLLTSHEPRDSQVMGWNENDEAIVLRLLSLALECRLAGIMCSPHEIKSVRKYSMPGFLLVTPGIRLYGKEVFRDDQTRVASPEEATRWGADLIVIGRPITEAREPRKVVEELFFSVRSQNHIAERH